MIVFTATDETSGKVFAGTTRNSLEDHWGDLLTQSAEGAQGEFYETVRNAGVDAFSVEEWGYSDNPKELREMLAEAVEELGATTIKQNKSGSSKVAVASKKASLSVMEELASLKEEFGDSEPAEAAAKPVVVPETAPKAALRHTKSTEEAAEMNAIIARIEMRRKSGRSSVKKSTTSRTTKTVKPAAEKVVQEKSKLATGRTGSSAKEKRIKEAIALEKSEREAQKRAQAAEEAAEMREIMARLDERTKAAARIHRKM